MKWAGAAAALLAALLLGGCAGLGVPSATPAAAGNDSPLPAAAPEQQGVGITITAPADLKALLERHLDLVRLGRMARDDVDDAEWSRLIDAAPAQVRDLLQTEGYFTPAVTLDRDEDRPAGRRETVRLKVDPGVRASIVRVNIEAEGALERGADAGDPHAQATLAQLRGRWSLQPGAAFRNPAWSEAKASSLARLRAAGYATASWSGTGAGVDAGQGTVRLFLVADSGPLFRYGSLEIEGLAAHDAQTVLNLAATPRGTPVTEALLLDYQERLQKSGLFDSVTVTLDTDPARADAARVLVRVREAPLQAWTFGVGISANTGPRATVEHYYRRVLGFAASAHNKVEFGQKRQFWEGEISSHPGENLYRNLVGGTVENLEGDSDNVLSQRVRVGRTQDGQRIERLLYVEAERSRRTVTVTDAKTNALALSLNFHGGWRDLDSIVLPTQGYTLAGQLGVGQSRGTDAATGIFSRAYLRLTGYLPVGQVWYGQARAEVGQVFLRNNMVVPESQKFRAGGDDSVRGYGYRSLGPLVDGVLSSGTALYTLSVEMARPVVTSMPALWGAVFIDAGNAANSYANLHPAVGAGVGVRWRSPVGPLRLDLAYGLETRKTRLHFSVGIAF